jgi:hypothetical protein
VSDEIKNPTTKALARIVQAHGFECALNGMAALIRREREAYVAAAATCETADRVRIVSGLLECAADKVGDASLDYYASTK